VKVQIHKLFDYLLSTTAEVPECVLGFSLSKSPRLRDFVADLDPNLSLDWNGVSFQGLPDPVPIQRQVRVQISHKVAQAGGF
jgi:hypothetical protein